MLIEYEILKQKCIRFGDFPRNGTYIIPIIPNKLPTTTHMSKRRDVIMFIARAVPANGLAPFAGHFQTKRMHQPTSPIELFTYEDLRHLLYYPHVLLISSYTITSIVISFKPLSPYDSMIFLKIITYYNPRADVDRPQNSRPKTDNSNLCCENRV